MLLYQLNLPPPSARSASRLASRATGIAGLDGGGGGGAAGTRADGDGYPVELQNKFIMAWLVATAASGALE